jgi:Tripartite tricarboxylate transporter TctB family
MHEKFANGGQVGEEEIIVFARRLHKDVVGGALMLSVGVAVAVRSTSYHIGSLGQMGPGYFPFALGVLLALVGVAIALKGHLQTDASAKGERRPEWRAWLLICIGVCAFIVLAQYAGLAAATFAIVFISALADRQNTWRGAAALALAMVAVAIVVFWWALKIQLPLFAWGTA